MRVALLLVMVVCLAGFASAYQSAEPFTRTPNITITSPKVPGALRGITPHFTNPRLLQYDIVVPPPSPPRLDPRTCAGEIAQCYQVRTHNYTGRMTYGKNYSQASGYLLPQARIKTFVCVGNDTACVARATNCFCPTTRAPVAPHIIGSTNSCVSTQHVCRSSYSGFSLCTGNISSCNDQYLACGCGKYAVCLASTRNTCVNDRDELFLCSGKLFECLSKYKTCFCGSEALELQKGCTTTRHACTSGKKTVTCFGSFTSCALKYDSCSC